MANETPAFMRRCIEAVRRNKSLYWAVQKAAEDCYGSPVSIEDMANITDRPKTPTWQEMYRYPAGRWLARFFLPVFMTWTDHVRDDDICIKTWIIHDRKDTGKLQPRGDRKNEKRFRADNFVIRARQLDKRHDWNTVK